MQPHLKVMARGLASAFLAEGDWSQAGLAGRAERAMGSRPKWLAALARAVRVRFREPPRDDRDALAAFIVSQEAFGKAYQSDEGRPVLRQWILDEPQMREVRWGVPALATAGELAAWLKVDPAELLWFADRRGIERTCAEPLRHYRYDWIAKRGGGLRLLEKPKPRLKEIQRKLLEGILDAIPAHPAVHGFRKGRSVLTFAKAHVGRAMVLRLDLEDFFASVGAPRVFAAFRWAGYPVEVASLLAGLCTNRVPRLAWEPGGAFLSSGGYPPSDTALLAFAERGRRFGFPHLPQGAPTSPALANLCAWRLDRRLSAFAASAGAVYTRYADDLVFSGDHGFARAARRFEIAAAAIAIEEGFALNLRKTQFMRAGARQRVAGVVVNRRLSISRTEVDELKAVLFNCARLGPQSQNRAGRPDWRAHLEGRVSWVASVHPERGRKLWALYSKIAWPSSSPGAPPDQIPPPRRTA